MIFRVAADLLELEEVRRTIGAGAYVDWIWAERERLQRKREQERRDGEPYPTIIPSSKKGFFR